MTMRAVIARNDETEKDENGQPKPPRFETVATCSCWAWSTGKLTAQDAGKTAVVEDFRAIVPRGTAVMDSDIVSSIKDRRARDVFPRARIRSVQYKHDHIELSLDRIDS